MLATLMLVATLAPPEDLRLLGIVASASAEHSVAILTAGGRTRIAAAGDSAFGTTLLSIGNGRVTVECAGEVIELRLAGQVSAAPPAPSGDAPATPAPEPAPAPPAVALRRSEVDRRIADEMSRILAETRLVPVREGLVLVGFSVARLPEGTLLSEVGLQQGDVLSEVNDVRLDSMATLISLWPRLQSAKQLRAVVRRGGERLVLRVELE